MKWRWRAKSEGRRQARPTSRNFVCRAGAGVLAQVRALLGRRDPRDPDGAGIGSDHGARSAWPSSAATRTPSAWCRPWASPSPASTSRRHRPVSDALDKLQKEKGSGHRRFTSTRASGGFLAPFWRRIWSGIFACRA
ncbi:MAG: hypothetical protein MZV65_31160 [Chromatiales bacterium]|nr:hypothetical protein [Chromatiales bacterium]